MSEVTYFKVKTVLPKNGIACKVEILENLGEKTIEYQGKKKIVYQYDIKLNDKELLRWDASENQRKNMIKVACNPFVIKRWDKDEKVGFNFFPPGDINVQPQNCEPNISSAQIEKKVQNSKDEYGDKASRGAAYNLAFSWSLQALESQNKGIKLQDFLGKIYEIAEQIAVHQKAFVNNEPVVAKETKTPEKPTEEATETNQIGTDISELPF